MTQSKRGIIRKDWDHYFMDMAVVAAMRATCRRRWVGALLVLENSVLSTGYNGSPQGEPHCIDLGCDCITEPSNSVGGVSCVATTHAEANAILQAARKGRATEGSTLYTTASPCWPCMKLIRGAGIVRVVYASDYPDKRFLEKARAWSMALLDLHEDYPPESMPQPSAQPSHS